MGETHTKYAPGYDHLYLSLYLTGSIETEDWKAFGERLHIIVHNAEPP